MVNQNCNNKNLSPMAQDKQKMPTMPTKPGTNGRSQPTKPGTNGNNDMQTCQRNPEPMAAKVTETIRKFRLIEPGDKLVLGVSGGPDSIAMLNVLIEICQRCQRNPEPMAGASQRNPEPLALAVAHINHMIREEANDDEEFVRSFCKEKNIEFYSKRINVQDLANTMKIGTEEAGRIARYDFFSEVLIKTNANKIAIAHNKNDKIETMIMNMLRGSGVNGLKGIEPKRGIYIRPLIECNRTEIEQYCEKHSLNPRIDKTNFENDYTRNKIRNIVIPYVKQEFNPNIIETLDRLSELLTDVDEYVEKQVQNEYKNLLIEENIEGNHKEIVLNLKQFNNQEKVIKSRLVLYTITRLFGSAKGIEKKHIEDIIKLCSNNIGNKYLTPNKNIKILVKNHKIYFTKQS